MKRKEAIYDSRNKNEHARSIFFIKLCIGVLIIFALAIANPASGLYESDNYIIPKGMISSGGSTSTSKNYIMTATIGQTSCIGMSNRGPTVLHAGFWTPEYFEMRSKALPFIPLLLLDD